MIVKIQIQFLKLLCKVQNSLLILLCIHHEFFEGITKLLFKFYPLFLLLSNFLRKCLIYLVISFLTLGTRFPKFMMILSFQFSLYDFSFAYLWDKEVFHELKTAVVFIPFLKSVEKDVLLLESYHFSLDLNICFFLLFFIYINAFQQKLKYIKRKQKTNIHNYARISHKEANEVEIPMNVISKQITSIGVL